MNPPGILLLFYLAILIAASWVDLRERRIPNQFVVPGVWVALSLAIWQNNLGSALIGAVGGTLFFAAPPLLRLPGVGMGDVKLAFFIGLILGWPAVITALEVTALVGALVALLGLALHRWDWRDGISYGPFLAIGAIAAWILNIVR